METVSFFCTRCRRLTTVPASRRGTIVYCPRCQQALITPDIPATGDDGENRGNDEDGGNEGNGADVTTATVARLSETGQNAAVAANKEKRGNWVGTTRRFGATIASHLEPEKERPENWRRVEIRGTSDDWNAENDEDGKTSLLEKKEVSDAEFLRRLCAEPQTRPVEVAPVAPPILADWGAESAANVGGRKIIRRAAVAAALVSAFAVGVGVADWRKNNGDGDAISVDKQVAFDSVWAEGALSYRTSNGTIAPDDGAFVFFFPSEERFGPAIALGNASPQRPTPPGFESVVADLEARGARFAVADFEGRFAFDDLEPGEYRVLLVSRRVGDDWGNANAAALKEIGRYIVSPRLLLGESRFFWTTRRFHRDAATLEKSFGKAGAPFSNVD